MRAWRFAVLLAAAFLFLGTVPFNPVLRLKLRSLSGKKVRLETIKNHDATVVVFLSPDCPLCQRYSKTLKEINAEFKTSRMQMIGVFPGPFAKDKRAARAFADTYGLDFLLLRDPRMRLTAWSQVRVTPGVVVLDRKGYPLYRGRIDNWYVELGKKRSVITAHDLRETLSDVRAGKTVVPRETEAVGCYIPGL